MALLAGSGFTLKIEYISSENPNVTFFLLKCGSAMITMSQAMVLQGRFPTEVDLL